MADFQVVGQVQVDDSGESGLKNVNANLSQIVATAGAAGAAFGAMGGSVVGVVGSIVTGIAKGVGAIEDFVGDSIKLAETHQDTMMQVNDAIVNYSQAANESLATTSTWMDRQADALSKVTRYSKDTVYAGEAVLLKFKSIGMDVMPDAITATADLAAKMGIDFPAAAQAMGRALEDPAAGIGRLNMQFGLFTKEQLKSIEAMAKQGKTAEAQKAILDALNKTVGGLAEDMGDTFAGKLAILNNTLDEAKIAVGNAFLPALTTLASSLTPMIEKFLPTLSDFFQNKLAPALQKGAEGLMDFVNSLVTGQKPTTDIGQKIAAIANDIGAFAQGVVNFAQGVISFFQGAAQIVQDAATTWGELPTVIVGTLKQASDAATNIINGFVGIGQGLVESISAGISNFSYKIAYQIVQGILNAINSVRKTVSDWEAAAHSLVDGLIKGIKDKIGEVVVQCIIMASQGIQAVKNILSSFSPSRVFMEIGYSIPQGLAAGIKAGSGLPQMAAGNMATGVINTVNNYNNRTTNIYNGGMSLYKPDGTSGFLAQSFRKA